MSSREPASQGQTAQHPTPQGQTTQHQPAQEHRSERQVTLRPAPKLVPFLVAGVLAALVIAVAMVIITGPAEDYTVAASVGYLTFVLSLATVSVSAILWLFLERRSRQHTRTYSATRTQNDPS